MEPLEHLTDIESRRMELRGVVRLAGEVIAQYWPMRTFVHHNPLHSIEYLPFEEAVRRGKQFMGGNGYLPCHLYREYLKAGRIRSTHLDDALKPRVIDKNVTIGSHTITHGAVLHTCLTEGLCAPTMEPLDDQLEDPDRPLIEALARKLDGILPPFSLEERIRTVADENQAALCRWLTLSHWCDETLGTQIVQQINKPINGS